MSQEIRHFTWCDPCEKEGTAEPGQTITVMVDGGKTMELDLCERHDKTVLGPVREFLTEYGHRADHDRTPVPGVPSNRPGRRAANPENHPCLWCSESFGSVSGIAFHLSSAHGFPYADEKQKRADITGVLGAACPYCGTKTSGPASFGMHIYRNHDGEPARMAAAAVRARELGDPAGVVAKIMAKAPHGQYRKGRR